MHSYLEAELSIQGVVLTESQIQTLELRTLDEKARGEIGTQRFCYLDS